MKGHCYVFPAYKRETLQFLCIDSLGAGFFKSLHPIVLNRNILNKNFMNEAEWNVVKMKCKGKSKSEVHNIVLFFLPLLIFAANFFVIDLKLHLKIFGRIKTFNCENFSMDSIGWSMFIGIG